jgi:UDP-N-acetylmuramate--alanine ligase
MERVPFYGMVVGCNDDAALRRLLPRVHRRVTTYGTSPGSDFLIRMGTPLGAGEHTPLVRFQVTYKDKDLGEFTLHVPGVHNVLNATAAIAVGTALDISPAQIRSALDAFRGVDRRFQLKGKAAGVSVIDDYGHHPTEIRATLAAARQCGFRRVHVIFQPHRFTRTRDLMDDFATAFADADTLCLLDIYPASEKPIEGITAGTLVSRIAGAGNRSVAFAPSFADAVSTVVALAKPGDMVLTLGAGSVSQLGAMIVEKLETKATPA